MKLAIFVNGTSGSMACHGGPLLTDLKDSYRPSSGVLMIPRLEIHRVVLCRPCENVRIWLPFYPHSHILTCAQPIMS